MKKVRTSVSTRRAVPDRKTVVSAELRESLSISTICWITGWISAGREAISSFSLGWSRSA
ncbi:hypothetical protein D3C75_1348180 [compost metagenome]